MRALIEQLFAEGAEQPPGSVGLREMDDGAAFPIKDGWLVLTTDSHVVAPRFFPGGDVGRLSISGTVNDLAMMGATEVLGLTCAVIIEDGFPIAELERIHASMRDTSREADAPVVTGDTKVMGRGELDGLVLNTTGVAITGRLVRDNGLRPGDRIVVTGTMGDHGFAVLAARQKLELQGNLRSDVAPLNGLVRQVLRASGEGVVAMKDPTRGGLASALHEMAEKSGVGIVLDEQAVPLSDEVRAASEILGIDPLHVANEGKAVLGVRPEALDRVMAALDGHPLGRRAAVVGTCIAEQQGRIVLDTGLGQAAPRRARGRSDAAHLLRLDVSAATHIRTQVEAGRRHPPIDRPQRFNSLDVVHRPGPAQGRPAAGPRSGGPGGGAAGRAGHLLQRGGPQVHPLRRRRGRARLPHPGRPPGPARARGDLQANPRVPPRHHLGDPPRAQAVHRRGGRRVRRRWARAGHGLRPGLRLGAGDLRVGVRQDRPLRRGELDASSFPGWSGLRFAAEMLLLNPRLDAAAARSAGLVNGVFSGSGFEAEVEAVARRIAAGPASAYAAAKQLFNEAMGVDRLDHHLDRELEALVRSADSPEFAEGIEAFFARRAPRFPGAG